MSPLDSHSLKVLEFEGVVAMLRARVPSSLGARALDALAPVPHREEVRRRQRRTSEMRRLAEGEAPPSWGGSQDISAELERLQAEGSWIEGQGLLRIAEFAESADRIRGRIARAGNDAPELNGIASSIAPFGELSAQIRRCVTDDGEVADTASPELAKLRRDIDQTRRETVRLLEALLLSAERSGAVQERIVTLRAERYVIPVKAGGRGSVPGLVHDRSASGQTLFIEPEQAVAKNNTLRELSAAEKEEVRRILRFLGSRVRAVAGELRVAMERLGSLEAIWSMAVLAADLDMCEPRTFDEEGRIDLRGARHPLLLATLGSRAIPVDFALGGETKTLVLTGPNTGGKTVVLKTVGLLVLMAQSGMQIPALAGSGFSCFPAVLADIGDEQSIEQNLSTFSGHLRNLVAVLERPRPGALILLDELGAGTDPTEGAALGIAVLEETLAMGALTVATTHHQAVKVFASATAGVVNASMEFDGLTLQPTYRLVVGVPGRSQAFHIAAGLGMKREIIERAMAHQGDAAVRLDRLTEDLEEARRGLETQRAALETAALEASRRIEQERREWERKREKLESEGRRALKAAEAELSQALRELKDGEKARGAATVKDALRKLEGTLRDQVPSLPREVDVGPLAPGERVLVASLRSWGVVEAVEGRNVTVLVQGKRCTVPRRQIGAKDDGGSPGRERRAAGSSYAVEIPQIASTRIDLRGMRVEEAVASLDRFLEDALLGGLQEISIVHGKGTGRLQEAVAAHLAAHGHVESFGHVSLQEGGAGVTRAKLAV